VTRWPLAALALAAAAAALAQPEPPKDPPAIRTKVVSVSARANVRIDDKGSPELTHSLTAAIDVAGLEGLCVLTGADLSHVLDTDEQDLVKPVRKQAPQRERAEFLFRHLEKTESFRHHATATLTRLPSRVSSLQGTVDGYRADRVVVKDLPFEPMDEPLELVPGVTFRWTTFKRLDAALLIAYEVRIAHSKGEPLNQEAIWGGLEATSHEGVIKPLKFSERRSGREDVVVITTIPFKLPPSHQPQKFSARAYEGLRPFQVNFAASGIDLAGNP
jgi:hypothetical protein